MAPKVWGYGRVSSVRQVKEGYSLESQAQVIGSRFREKYGKSEYVWGDYIKDEGVSGRVPFIQRKGGALLNSMLEKGDIIIFSKLDRGFRNIRDLLEMCEIWRARGVKMECLDLGLDTGTPVGRMVLAILAAVAEFERERISERVREGFEQMKLKGRRNGRARKGEKWVKVNGKGELVDDDFWLKRMKRIYELRCNGHSFQDIAWSLDKAKLFNYHNGKHRYWSPDSVKHAFLRYVAKLAKEGLSNGTPPEEPRPVQE